MPNLDTQLPTRAVVQQSTEADHREIASTQDGERLSVITGRNRKCPYQVDVEVTETLGGVGNGLRQ